MLALKAFDIGNDDEVIVPANTFIATALAVTYVGAKPVLVEPDINTYNIDPKLYITPPVISNTIPCVPREDNNVLNKINELKIFN